eukprot:5261524-Alexandrium_andersonii.AAC.1
MLPRRCFCARAARAKVPAARRSRAGAEVEVRLALTPTVGQMQARLSGRPCGSCPATLCLSSCTP